MSAAQTGPAGPRAAIGVFDSGVGGLTVLRALRRELPGADFIYLGDTARLPYGTKSAASVVRYAEQAADVLVGAGPALPRRRLQHRLRRRARAAAAALRAAARHRRGGARRRGPRARPRAAGASP